MMPTFPRSPLSFRTAGFPQYGWKAGLSGGAFPDRQRLKPAPGIRLLTAGLPSPFVHLRVGAVAPVLRRAADHDDAPPWRVGRPPPQGPSLGSGLCCPGPSSLNRAHPPHSQAHRDFTAWRLIRDAFAVRERRGDPRVVPGFRYHSVLTCRPLRPRGVRTSHVSSCAMPTRPSPSSERLGTPNTPAIRFARGTSVEASLVRVCYGLSVFSPPLDGSDRVSPATGGFYIQASGGSVALPVAGYHYNSNWTPLLAGLSPAGMAASLAAPDLTEFPSHRGLLHPGFRRVGRPSRGWI